MSVGSLSPHPPRALTHQSTSQKRGLSQVRSPVLLSEELRPHYVQAMRPTVSLSDVCACFVCMCVCFALRVDRGVSHGASQLDSHR